jgi:hypothetical protein
MEESRHAEAHSDSGSRDGLQAVEEGVVGRADRGSPGVGSAECAASDRAICGRRRVGCPSVVSDRSASVVCGASASTKGRQGTAAEASGVGVGADSCVSGSGGRPCRGGPHDSALAVRRAGRRAARPQAGSIRSRGASPPGVADGCVGRDPPGERPARELAAHRRRVHGRLPGDPSFPPRVTGTAFPCLKSGSAFAAG